MIAHSDKQDAAATWKKTYGHHPLTAFADHGPRNRRAGRRPAQTGERGLEHGRRPHHHRPPRPGPAAEEVPARAADPDPLRFRRGTHDFVSWLAKQGRWLSYSVGMVITETTHSHVLKIPAPAWTPAIETDGEIRDGAWVAELTGDVLTGWPKGMRLIIRKERPHPGAQLRITDADGMRITCFATNTPHRPIAELELRHRLRARAEDRIRAARATGLRNLPLHHTAQNKVWVEIVQIALDLLA